jgi:poly(A) polymerase
MAKKLPSLADQVWLKDERLQHVLRVLSEAGGEGRVAGGAIRNALMGEPVTEVDIATSLPPSDVERVCKAAKFAVHATGIEHGTLTIVVQGTPFEVTTLRKDITTDGRRAKVKFTDDWREDAQRRDFTINAMYCDAQGQILDYTNGYKDIQTRTVKFVGNPGERIKEDYLRILRFFRFHARYGKGSPNKQGLSASKRLRKGIETLSAERIRQEMLKLLVAPRGVPTLKVMHANGILKSIIPHTDDWRTLARLPADGLLRLAVLAKEPHKLKSSFRLSNDEARRLVQLFAAPSLTPRLRPAEQHRLLYALGESTWTDAVNLSWSKSRATLSDPKWQALRDLPTHWKRPVFPVNGKDLMERGIKAGPALGNTLRRLEDWWIASDFKPSPDEILRRL